MSTSSPSSADAPTIDGSPDDPGADEPGAAVRVACECGRTSKVPPRLVGRILRCPFCRRPLRARGADGEFEEAPGDGGTADAAKVEPAREVEPARGADARRSPEARAPSLAARAFEALLDPRSTQWLLMLGGGLAVIGILVWLVSRGVFENPVVLAVGLAAGTTALLAAGWWVSLKTRYAVAGRALTSLACVVAPLNLWFLHAQGLVTVDQNLWVGGLVCCLLYGATIRVLRDPAFVYAALGGVVLTALLILGDLGKIADPTWLSLFLMAMGLIALHAERAFAPDAPVFRRDRFGRPLFHGGHLLVAASLLTLFCTQAFGWAFEPLAAFLNDWNGNTLTRPTNRLANDALLAAGVWLAGAYAYAWSELVVRRTGRDLYVAAGCVVMAELTALLGTDVPVEGLIAALGLTALAANAAQLWLVRRGGATEADPDVRAGLIAPAAFDDSLPRVGVLLNALPLVVGAAVHWRATSAGAAAMGWTLETGWAFVGAMAVVAACNRTAAWLFREASPRWAAAYLFFTGAALLIGAAGLLRAVGVDRWVTQAPLLMLVPIAYLAAMRLWRGRSPARPLYWVAQGGAAVILAHVAVATLREIAVLDPVRGQAANLWLGLTFALAAAFYFLAALWRGDHRFNVPAGAAAATAALWQLLGYWDVPGEWHAAVYAGLGLTGILVARARGLEVTFERPETPADLFPQERPRSAGAGRGRAGYGEEPDSAPPARLTGRGAVLFYCGAGVLLVAALAAGLRGLSRLAAGGVAWVEIVTLLTVAAAAAVASAFGPLPSWRRAFAVSAVALTGLAFLTLNELLALSGWRKLEIFCVTAGLLALAAALAARLRGFAAGHADLVTLGAWLGATLAVFPPLIAALAHRFGDGPSLPDELALITLTVLLLVAGLATRTQAPTLLGGGGLAVYLVVLIGMLAYQPQAEVGVYLAAGGLLLFAAGVALSVYRDRLRTLPDRIAARQGLFRVLDWR